MIASKFPTTLFRASGRNVIDLPVAALAGLSVAFAAFTIPADLLGEAVSATGLASLIPAAGPPLGTTARVVMAVAGAIAAFSAAFVLLRWLDRFASRPGQREIAPAPATEVGPRLHKADAHPDAPPRRPISAHRDLGEPAPPSAPVDWLDDPQAPPASAVPVPITVPATPEPASLGHLMARLEQGLAKRAAAEAQGDAAPHAPAPLAGDRLQSAIDSLQRLAKRGD